MIQTLKEKAIEYMVDINGCYRKDKDFASELKEEKSLQAILAVARLSDRRIPHDKEINGMSDNTKEECIECINKILYKYPHLMEHENLLRIVASLLHREKIDEDTEE